MYSTRLLPADPDLLVPDGSQIRVLPAPERGGASVVHCRLPAGAMTKAVAHRTVEEVWYVAGGQGEIWRALGAESDVTALTMGTSLTIPLGTRFQFRNTGSAPLDIIIDTLPPCPGEHEAERVPDFWGA